MMTSTRLRTTARLAGAALVVAGVIGVTAQASAHNFVVSTTPAEGSTLTVLPERFDITTNDALLDVTGNASAFVFDIRDADGLYYGDGCVTVEGSAMFTDAALGEAGEYTIGYQLVSADGHTVSGDYTFTWAPEPGHAMSFGWDTPPVCGEERTPQQPELPDNVATPEPTAEPTATPEAPASGGIAEELLWVGGAVAAIIVAIALATLLLRRRN